MHDHREELAFASATRKACRANWSSWRNCLHSWMPLTRFLAHQANHRSSDRCLDVAPTSSGIRSRPVLASGLMDTQRAPS